MIATGAKDLETDAGHQQLASWLAMDVFGRVLNNENETQTIAPDVIGTGLDLTDEELDISHYIGGCAVSKLIRRSSALARDILQTFIDSTAPQPQTLLAAKSRGKLTNLKGAAKSIFSELEYVFRIVYPQSACSKDISINQYANECYDNQIIQDCFNTLTKDIEDDSAKEHVLSNIISFYFKVRVHHRCKTTLDIIRAQNKTSSKDRALRAKLAK